MINLFNMDCMTAMAGMKDKEYDLAIVDPPYGIGVNHNMGRRAGDRHSDYKKVDWDNFPPNKTYFNELIRVSINQIIWGANHFGDMPSSSCWIVWDKGFSEDVSFAQVELAWSSFKSVSKKFNRSPSQKNRFHPTQKPVALYKWLLTNYAKTGDRILDTHGGSMSIAIACHDLGFDLDLYEIDEAYFKAGADRLKRHQAQGRLF